MKAGWAGKVWGKFSRVIYGLLAEQELNLLPLPSQAVCWSRSQPPPGWGRGDGPGHSVSLGKLSQIPNAASGHFPLFFGFFLGGTGIEVEQVGHTTLRPSSAGLWHLRGGRGNPASIPGSRREEDLGDVGLFLSFTSLASP